MPCYTVVLVDVPEDQWTARARKALGLPLKGGLSQRDARRVTKEAGILKAMDQVRRQAPTAIIRRTGDELTVTAER